MKTLYIGIDVDDQAFHGTGVCPDDGQELSFKCKPTHGALLKKLKPLTQKYHIKTCYESSYKGYSLHRFLTEQKIINAVIAPSSIPKAPHDRVKNDRIDSKKLAIAYSKSMLTEVHVPDEETEVLRGLVRSRHYLVKKRSSLKRHILSKCRIRNWSYNESAGPNKQHWTLSHLQWLNNKIKACKNPFAAADVKILLRAYNELGEQIELYNEEIAKAAELAPYKKQVAALQCFRGLALHSAFSLAVEIGDVRRFKGPRQLTSYAGLDIREYSSGGHQRQGGITKHGNKYIRTLVIEACQSVARPVAISRRLKEQHKKIPDKLVAIATKSMKRLRKRSLHLQMKNKPTNKIKVACARELLGSIWAVLGAVQGERG